MTLVDAERLREWVGASGTRMEFWPVFVKEVQAATVAEIGVYRGAFAARLLAECPDVAVYYMIDPWRHLAGWNKPANKPDDVFERYFREAMDKTGAWADKRVVLRGTTADVINRVPDGGLDFAYVDGDHTLRGITIDLIKVFPKVRAGGWIAGDDFSPSIWQHSEDYEPTLVCPFAVYFAEAVESPIYALPRKQFLIEKTGAGFEFVDLTAGRYGSLDLRRQLIRRAPEEPDRSSGLAQRIRRRLDR
jgi:predicted O-methyltransferase YrrM